MPERSLIVFVELDTRYTDGFTVSLRWDRDTGQTQIVVNDARTANETVFGVPHVNAADAFRHPFRYAP
jgi:carotenoid cleavage dioxygenase-like enzyme